MQGIHEDQTKERYQVTFVKEINKPEYIHIPLATKGCARMKCMLIMSDICSECIVFGFELFKVNLILYSKDQLHLTYKYTKG